MLVKVSAGKGETYINIDLDNVAEVSVSRNGEPGYRSVRGAQSSITLKDGNKYLTDPNEVQRIVDAMRNLDEKKSS